ncbi:uncharacterized protein LOC123346058 isoform X2 [Mauremys mutica]|nr:uncharacterized protein LOC123346058 isoform X2 [Mauremys mutica]
MCDRGTMTWHQSLKNPIPNFNLNLTETFPVCRATKTAPKVTWGQVKRLAQQAQQTLENNKAEPTPEYFIAAIFACLTANSFTILLCCFCVLPAGAEPELHSRMRYNIWARLAILANQFSFCLQQAPEMGLLGTCLVPVCTAPGNAANAMGMLNFMNATEIQYSSMSLWGQATYVKPASALSLFTPRVANHANLTCVRMVNCTRHKSPKGCLRVGTPGWNCTHFQNVSSNYGHILLPEGWFFTCGQRTFNYIPANISEAQCCLSRLTLILPTRSVLTGSQINETRTRRRRSSTPMRSECNANVSLFSRAEYISLAVSLVGLPALGVANHQQLSRLACALVKNINYTFAALALLN